MFFFLLITEVKWLTLHLSVSLAPRGVNCFVQTWHLLENVKAASTLCKNKTTISSKRRNTVLLLLLPNHVQTQKSVNRFSSGLKSVKMCTKPLKTKPKWIYTQFNTIY